MAKGQKRSNRELRKPKKAEETPKADTPFGAQVKASSTNLSRQGSGK